MEDSSRHVSSQPIRQSQVSGVVVLFMPHAVVQVFQFVYVMSISIILAHRTSFLLGLLREYVKRALRADGGCKEARELERTLGAHEDDHQDYDPLADIGQQVYTQLMYPPPTPCRYIPNHAQICSLRTN